MSFPDALKIAAAVVVSLGGGAAIVFSLSSWLGKIWAERILASDRRKYEHEMESLKAQLAVTVKEFEIKTASIQDDRKRVILAMSPLLTNALISVNVLCMLGSHLSVKDDHKEAVSEANVYLKALRDKASEGRLFFSAELFGRLDKFMSQIGGMLAEAAHCMRTNSTISDSERVEMRARLLAHAHRTQTLHNELEIIFGEFRKILGTHR